jgi:hypothetical protein
MRSEFIPFEPEQVAVVPSNGGEPIVIGALHASSKPIWLNDSKHIYSSGSKFNSASGYRGSIIASFDLAGKMELLDFNDLAFGLIGKIKSGFVARLYRYPLSDELYIIKDGKERRLTHINKN